MCRMSKAARDAGFLAARRKSGGDLWHRLFSKRSSGADLQLPAIARFYRILQSSGDLGLALFVGTFNFGLGYQISQSTRLNLSVGIGAGPNTPVAKVLLEVPYKFSL